MKMATTFFSALIISGKTSILPFSHDTRIVYEKYTTNSIQSSVF